MLPAAFAGGFSQKLFSSAIADNNHRRKLVTNRVLIQEWKIDSWRPRLRERGLPFTIRFAVTLQSDWLYGINISIWSKTYDAHGASPVEIEIN
jgi:hypothetical protein